MLSKKAKANLANAMGSKALAEDLEVAILADATLTAKQKRNLGIALADRKAADDLAQAIDAGAGSLADRSKRAIKNMMITKAEADELIAAIES